ncbi:hypothetical protein, partial [Mycobacterium kansasii]|uniref:hypothetical protein n=1 Tax=Mycobacterium kansasii TaxID=1768 RepID=UPI00195604F5
SVRKFSSPDAVGDEHWIHGVSMNEIDLQKARMRAVEAIDKLAEKERLGELMKKHGISRTTRSRSSYMEIFPPPWPHISRLSMIQRSPTRFLELFTI